LSFAKVNAIVMSRSKCKNYLRLRLKIIGWD
jgi:hypothetical protein